MDHQYLSPSLLAATFAFAFVFQETALALAQGVLGGTHCREDSSR